MPYNIAKKIRGLRLERNISQEQAAHCLEMSRPTYVSLENGMHEVTFSELEKLAALFSVSCDVLIHDAAIPKKIHVELPAERKMIQADAIRINVPQKNLKKFKEVLLYILGRIGAMPHVGETVLYKLLYFIDFDYYEKYEEQLIGATYIKNKYGPTPVEFKKIVDFMKNKSEIEIVRSVYFRHEQRKYLPLRQPDLSVLSGREIEHINEVLARLGNKNAMELSTYSHEDVPWVTADNGDVLEYEAVFYRTPKTTVRNYETPV
jgi:transcriptional regulator with XRE-family HTH domain